MQYQGYGFWVRDYQAEVWLYLLAQQAQAMADNPPWLTAAGSDWRAQATNGPRRLLTAAHSLNQVGLEMLERLVYRDLHRLDIVGGVGK